MDDRRLNLPGTPTPSSRGVLRRSTPPARGVSRRSALLLPLLLPALSGCSWFDWLTDEEKKSVPGNREPVLASLRGLQVDSVDPVVLPPVATNADWLQYGGTVSHVGGNLAGGLNRAWVTTIGEGGAYRARITAQPLVSGSRAYTMDTDGVVACFDLANGSHGWRTPTKPRKAHNSNLGGGIAIEGDRLYAVTGRAEALCLGLADGRVIWRVALTSPARSAPTIAEGTLFVATMDEQLQALSLADGRFVWAHQATAANTGTIGQAGPAYANGVVVAGFESGDLAALRADSGTLVWTDNMGGIKGQASLSDFGSVRAAPVIDNDLVYAIGLGGLMAALDIRSGRRVWQRDVAGSSTPWLAGDIMYVVSSEQKLAAVGRDDGSVHWATDLPRFQNPKRSKGLITWTGPVLVGGKLVLVSDHAKMAVVDPISGTLAASLNLSDTASTPPTVAQDTVLVLTDDGKLTAYK